ncbi:hypothetical protein [Corynebacterium dentalis]|uniref:hypothetical protein n=1 Tax=Corynebacterium dentalis TaxID=2014528 RepID=UPI0028996573|nr:hypothetical protein [Corynebacterium dentalis]
MEEAKEERFRRLAKSRGERLLREIRLLGNLSNKKNYDYLPEDIEKLFDPLEKELAETKARFRYESRKKRSIEF